MNSTEPVLLNEQKRLPLAITSAPERIWLDLGFNPYEEDAYFSNLHDLTWSQDNATGYGIEYVRADHAAQDDSLTAAYMAGAHDAKAAARAATPYAPAIEDEIRRQDEALIKLLLEALECSGEPDGPGNMCSHCDDYVDRNSRLRNVARLRLEIASLRERVRMWGEDGSEFGITAAKKGGQHGTE